MQFPVYFSCIFCREKSSNGFGYKNSIPWRVDEDMKEFKKITTQNTSDSKYNILIMGKNTWNSIGKSLSHRISLVISSSPIKKESNVFVFPSLNECWKSIFIWKKEKSNLLVKQDSKVFVIGGTRLLDEAFLSQYLESIYESVVQPKEEYKFDVFFHTKVPVNFKIVSETLLVKSDYSLTTRQYNRMIETDERRYLKLLEDVIENGNKRDDRTQIGTISLFSPPQLEFDLQKGFPLLTTKRVYFKGIVEELLWMLRGQTDNKILQQKGVHIWDGNSSRSFLDSHGLAHFPEGETGKIYSYQWRHTGGQFVAGGIHTGGYDQIGELIKEIQKNPTSRRMLVCAWNPNDLKEMSLPPCHFAFQCYVSDGQLDLKLSMRSNDLFLGAPFNIASYALLTHMIAHVCHLKPRRLIYSIGDAHIYQNHIEQVKEQVLRPCRSFPSFFIRSEKKIEKLEEFSPEMFHLENYDPHPVIKGEMAV